MKLLKTILLIVALIIVAVLFIGPKIVLNEGSHTGIIIGCKRLGLAQSFDEFSAVGDTSESPFMATWECVMQYTDKIANDVVEEGIFRFSVCSDMYKNDSPIVYDLLDLVQTTDVVIVHYIERLYNPPWIAKTRYCVTKLERLNITYDEYLSQ